MVPESESLASESHTRVSRQPVPGTARKGGTPTGRQREEPSTFQKFVTNTVMCKKGDRRTRFGVHIKIPGILLARTEFASRDLVFS